ncbi:MAG: MogA/MoaB family molybdenum cofactor biosynthesis protein [Caldisericia bacterium]|nr:MogA/MoaB family molybdenum cofactor biosynthesis protein [Caldisericia bacterium]
MMDKIRIGIIVVSDSASRGARVSTTEQIISELLKPIGKVIEICTIQDEILAIQTSCIRLVDQQRLDLIITTGGTGLSPRDVTPEATRMILDKEIPGIAECMRQKTSEFTMQAYLSRATAGLRKQSLIINLPGSKKAVTECLEAILPLLPHALEVIQGQVNRCGG